jgi:hypothetical protein
MPGISTSSDSLTLGQHPEPSSGLCAETLFDVRFLLTEPELQEAAAKRNPLAHNPFVKVLAQVISGLGAVFLPLVPHMLGQTWLELLKSQPVGTVFVITVTVVNLWVATGAIGSAALNRRVNRLDLERHIMFTDLAVQITHGGKTREMAWKRFSSFAETPDLFILETVGIQFWAIPKRALPPGCAQKFRLFLTSKVRPAGEPQGPTHLLDPASIPNQPPPTP